MRSYLWLAVSDQNIYILAGDERYFVYFGFSMYTPGNLFRRRRISVSCPAKTFDTVVIDL